MNDKPYTEHTKFQYFTLRDGRIQPATEEEYIEWYEAAALEDLHCAQRPTEAGLLVVSMFNGVAVGERGYLWEVKVLAPVENSPPVIHYRVETQEIGLRHLTTLAALLDEAQYLVSNRAIMAQELGTMMTDVIDSIVSMDGSDTLVAAEDLHITEGKINDTTIFMQ